MDDRRKRARLRLAELGRTSYVSKSGMEALLTEFRAIPVDDLPEHLSRGTISRACAEAWSLTTSYGNLFQSVEVRLMDGELTLIHMLAPLPLLEHLLAECRPFAERFWASLQANPVSSVNPWSMGLYSDEVSPGNAIKHDNQRRSQVIYWTFVELGGLGNEHLWFPLVVVRSGIVALLEGGMSHLMRIVLRSFFDNNGHNLKTSGMLLRFGDHRVWLFAQFALKIADESALHQTWLNKGANGLIMCLYCSNCASKDSGLAGHHGYVCCTCLDIERFVLHSNQSVRGYVRHLADQAEVLNQTNLEAVETKLGFNHNAQSLLNDRDLEEYVDPIGVTMVDWCHTWLVSGVWNLILGLLLRMLDPRIKYADLAAFLKLWSWPRAYETQADGTDIGSAKRAKSCLKEGTFKCAASEALSVYAIIRMWVQSAVLPTCEGVERVACLCYIAACTVIDLLKRTQRAGHTVTPVALHRATVDCLRYFLAAFGVEAWIPKCHLALHFGLLLQWHGYLCSCFVHERKHKIVKLYGNHMDRLTHFERVVLREVFFSQRAALRTTNRFCLVPHTQKPSKRAMAVLSEAFPDAVDIMIAPEVHIGDCGRCAKGDVVMLQTGVVARVWMHAVVDGAMYSCISRFARGDGEKWVVRREPVFVETSEIKEALIYNATGDIVVVIPPLGL